MEVTINQQKFTLTENSIAAVLACYGLANTKGLALAINQKVIPKIRWEAVRIQANDEITLITAAQGG